MSKTVAILGTGVVGTTLAGGFAARSDRVVFGTRDPHGAKATDALAAVPGATASTFVEAAKAGDFIVVALPWEAVTQTLDAAVAEAVADKLVIDSSNPLAFADGKPTLAIGQYDSAGETVQRLLPTARVVKAFNIITAGHMVRPKFADGTPDMFIAGNEDAAKREVISILGDFGWRAPIDMGDITASRLLEALAMLWISYGFRNNHWTHGFSLLGRKL